MLAAFWLFSGVIIVSNVVTRLRSPEPKARSYLILPPLLASDAGAADQEEGSVRLGVEQSSRELNALAAGAD